MPLANVAYLVMVVAAFSLFAVVLGGGAIYVALTPRSSKPQASVAEPRAGAPVAVNSSAPELSRAA